MNIDNNDLEDILSQALATIKNEMGENFSIDKVNLAEMQRLTHISRAKLRHLKENGFIVKPNGNKGKKFQTTVISGFETVIDHFLESNVTNSEVKRMKKADAEADELQMYRQRKGKKDGIGKEKGGLFCIGELDGFWWDWNIVSWNNWN